MFCSLRFALLNRQYPLVALMVHRWAKIKLGRIKSSKAFILTPELLEQECGHVDAIFTSVSVIGKSLFHLGFVNCRSETQKKYRHLLYTLRDLSIKTQGRSQRIMNDVVIRKCEFSLLCQSWRRQCIEIKQKFDDEPPKDSLDKQLHFHCKSINNLIDWGQILSFDFFENSVDTLYYVKTGFCSESPNSLFWNIYTTTWR